MKRTFLLLLLIIVPLATAQDFDGNGEIGISDLILLLNNEYDLNYDLNNDNLVNIKDFVLVAKRIGKKVCIDQDDDGFCVTEGDNLREVSDQLGLRVGSTATSYQIKNEQGYADAVKVHFNHLTSDWEFHWGFDENLPFRPNRTSYDFYWVDEMLKFAEQNDMSFEAHHLVWGYEPSLPDWLLNNQYTKEELLQIMQEHIETVVGRYKGRIAVWTVVNEPFGFFPLDGTFWHENLGPDTEWIDKAFLWADAADPDAILILNDAGIEFPDNPFKEPEHYDRVFNLVSDMKQRSIPIDGIGFQMHLNAKEFEGRMETKMQQLAQNIQRYKKAGLDVYITELDVRINELEGTEQERLNFQAEIYREVVRTALKNGV
ncbi:MAG: endo-1,4-beta-xylanase, partial [Candidatus Hodarchaeales archaeon]